VFVATYAANALLLFEGFEVDPGSTDPSVPSGHESGELHPGLGWNPASNSEAGGMYFRREGRILERGGTGRGTPRLRLWNLMDRAKSWQYPSTYKPFVIS